MQLFNQRNYNIDYQNFKQTMNYIIKQKTVLLRLLELVQMTGVEPARVAPHDPESCASANFATSANAIVV